MTGDIFKDILVPVIGGLGLFMLGLEFVSNGIQALAVDRLRSLLGRVAGTPLKGLFAGTFITGIIQSSTAMTVMIVGLVNAGILGLRPAIGVIMGANIGTTLGNGLIALPLGPIGLLAAGLCALVFVFSRNDRIRNIALASLGFGLIFYGLNLMTGGLRPLRDIPEIMTTISALNADSFVGVLSCIVTAALITAMIHSSSATIGIVMGLGAAGVLDWQTAVAFALGADLGTTVTSWMASLNLSRNAKRAAYAHIGFNIVGVLAMLPLFFPAIHLLDAAMAWFGGDPGRAVIEQGHETFPLVPLAVGIFSTAFNIFNTALLFPFVGAFHRLLLRIGYTAADDNEDYSQSRHLDARLLQNLPAAIGAIQRETARYLDGARQFVGIARNAPGAPMDADGHAVALDALSRQIRDFTAHLFATELPADRTDLVASLVEEEDWTASLGDTLHQIARRIRRQRFGGTGQSLVDDTLTHIDRALTAVCDTALSRTDATTVRNAALLVLRARCLEPSGLVSWSERGAILALLGSAERAFVLIDRIDAERRSVSRTVTTGVEADHIGEALAAT